MTPIIRALVLRAPGINCDRETAQACRLAGFATDLLHINQLLKTPSRLLDYTFLVIPGGFSYGDDLGAGTLLAKNLTIHLGPQLRQFVDEGRPVLGICNGFQVLVRAGLLPGHTPGSSNILNTTESTATSETPIASLTDNMSAQFECRWITLSIEPSNCIFTQGIEHPIELPVAHGEGQFVLTDAALLAQLQANGQVPMVYTAPSGQDVSYPHNPNGSIGNIAGVCNQRGNVFGLMPHPERYVSAMQHPQRHGDNDGTGDGLLIFKNAYAYATLWARQSYATSGVDIAAADTAKALMQDAVHATHGPTVLTGMGAFAGVLDISSIQQMQQPALVASTDGVGTKTLLAITCPPDRLQAALATIGHDLVNHSVNDLLMQGAKPLFFMDYLAMGKLDPVQAATIVRGVAEACQQVGCALLGGETAEMPDVYLPGAFDLAGTIVGIVERAALV
ncbi:MAG: phosphoribosylformylglycinamidine synthase I, partial [Ktedonobacteraceae bacterium]